MRATLASDVEDDPFEEEINDDYKDGDNDFKNNKEREKYSNICIDITSKIIEKGKKDQESYFTEFEEEFYELNFKEFIFDY